MTHGILVRPTGDTLLLRYPDSGDVSAWIEKQIVEVLNYDRFIGADVKRRYVRMEDGTEVEFETLNDCMKFIQSTVVPGALVIAEDEEEP